jgi:hypothetical protein
VPPSLRADLDELESSIDRKDVVDPCEIAGYDFRKNRCNYKVSSKLKA